MVIKELLTSLNELAPFSLQEDYDNSGLIVGEPGQQVSKGMVALDITEEVIDEAIEKKCDVVISHHPFIFQGLKKVTGSRPSERILVKAIKNDLAVISLHTNLDNIYNGVNQKISSLMGLKDTRILDARYGYLKKLVVFCPVDHSNNVRMAIFKAGGGKIGDYDWCSYNIEGLGSFRAGEGANPFVGNVKELHFEKETRIETIYPSYIENDVINAMIDSHPYEEVAYDIYPIDNVFDRTGAGMIGRFEKPLSSKDFLSMLEKIFNTGIIKHSSFPDKKIENVALCGGSGSHLLDKAIDAKADAFVTADVKYHRFFDAQNKILLADIGHYESEQFTKDLIYEMISEKIINFALQISEINTNPVQYFRTK